MHMIQVRLRQPPLPVFAYQDSMQQTKHKSEQGDPLGQHSSKFKKVQLV
jgi:hypothetical protein